MNKIKIRLKKITILSCLVSCLLFPVFINTASATTPRYGSNFDDTTPEFAYKVNDNTGPAGFENLASFFNMGEGTVICTGVAYYYANYGPGTGPYDVTIRFEGDTLWVGYGDSGIPNVGLTPSWRTFRCTGPTYLLDDDPWVRFIGTDPSDNCIALCGDTVASPSNSYYDVGSGWTLDTSGEYIVELIYEWVISLNENTADTGSITTTDFVDAYFVTLTGGKEYDFVLDRTSGMGNLDMRLVVNQDLTNNILVQSSGSLDPEYMKYTPSTTGTYVLLVEPNTPVTDTADYSIQYYCKPFADFTVNATTILENETVQFTFTGTEGDTPTTYLWDFGDSSPTSSSTNPTHKYNTSGTYTVSLTVTDTDSDQDSEIKTDYIVVETDIFPTANFSTDKINIIQGDSIQLTFTGTEGNSPPTYLWDFGDGSTSTVMDPIHQYLIPGTYTINLTVTDRNGDSDNETKQDLILVNPNQVPTANFTVNITSIFEGEWIEFTFTGNEGDVPATYQWDFGDGTNSTDQNPIHQYNTAGIYSVELNVTDINGDSGNETKVDLITVVTDLLPNATFIANGTSFIGHGWVQFNFTGSEGNPPATYLWDFGDGSTSTEQNPIHYYNLTGDHTVNLTVTDNDGDQDTEIKNNFISIVDDLLPNADFSASNTNVEVGEIVVFTFTGSLGNTPTTYLWDFGDGSTSPGQNPSHQYTTAGNYTVSLTITDANGDYDTSIKVDHINVEEIPQPDTSEDIIPGYNYYLIIGAISAICIIIIQKKLKHKK